jgi:hypothetical protein
MEKSVNLKVITRYQHSPQPSPSRRHTQPSAKTRQQDRSGAAKAIAWRKQVKAQQATQTKRNKRADHKANRIGESFAPR